MGEPVKSEDEFARADRGARREGLGCLTITLAFAALGLAWRWFS